MEDTMKTNGGADRQSADVPEGIKRHAPRPVLRPDGSWRTMADAVDRAEFEKAEASAVRRRARMAASRRLRLGFRMSRSNTEE
jgi:hypothetical protein